MVKRSQLLTWLNVESESTTELVRSKPTTDSIGWRREAKSLNCFKSDANDAEEVRKLPDETAILQSPSYSQPAHSRTVWTPMPVSVGSHFPDVRALHIEQFLLPVEIYYGNHSKQVLRYTQKPTHFPIFTQHNLVLYAMVPRSTTIQQCPCRFFNPETYKLCGERDIPAVKYYGNHLVGKSELSWEIRIFGRTSSQ